MAAKSPSIIITNTIVTMASLTTYPVKTTGQLYPRGNA